MKSFFLAIILWLSGEKEKVEVLTEVISDKAGSYSAKGAKVPIEPMPDYEMLMTPEHIPLPPPPKYIIPPIICPPQATRIDRPLYDYSR